MSVEKCSNCEAVIGKMETAHLFNENVVCAPCKIKLDKNEQGMLDNLPRGFDGDDNATQAELKMATQLGLTVADGINRRQIRTLIDRATGKEPARVYENIPPTDKQIGYAASLGIPNPEQMSRGQLSDEIDMAIAQGRAATKSTKTEAPFPKEEKKGEIVVLTVGPAWFRSRPFSFLISLLILPTMILIPLSIFLWVYWILIAKGTSLIITNRKTTLRRGILSKSTTEVRHKDIRNISIKQSVLERFFNVGTIGISSAGQSDIEIKVYGLSSPEKVASKLREFQE
jgi:membrane protein YdbS with pleckstrin-like domain